MSQPEPPTTRRVTVDCTVTIEVTVQYDPIADTAIVERITPDWQSLQVGLAYWHSTQRMANIGVTDGVHKHIERCLPKGLDMRWNPTTNC